MDIMDGETFTATEPWYTPKAFAAMYRDLVGPMSYPMALGLVEVYRTSGGTVGIYAQMLHNGRYLIPASEVERVIGAAMAARKGR